MTIHQQRPETQGQGQGGEEIKPAQAQAQPARPVEQARRPERLGQANRPQQDQPTSKDEEGLPVTALGPRSVMIGQEPRAVFTVPDQGDKRYPRTKRQLGKNPEQGNVEDCPQMSLQTRIPR